MNKNTFLLVFAALIAGLGLIASLLLMKKRMQ
jgi:hypothetical protein